MKYIVTYAICGKVHKTRVESSTNYSAEYKVRNSFKIIKVKLDDDDIVENLKDILGMKK